MTVVDDRPSIEEKVGVAMNTTTLKVQVAFECAADRLGGLGAATFQRDADGVPMCHPETKVVLRNRRRELVACLWRLKYGRDSTVTKACVLQLLELLRHDGGRARRVKPEQQLRFVERVIHEWVSDQCPSCEGRTTKGGTRGGTLLTRRICPECDHTGSVEHWPVQMLMLVWSGDHDGQVAVPVMKPCSTCNARGWLTKSERYGPERERACTRCNGVGRRNINDADLHQQRTTALRIGLAEYFQHWKRRFLDIHATLAKVDDALRQGLQSEMKAGSIRSQS